jgi:hypothetical protein
VNFLYENAKKRSEVVKINSLKRDFRNFFAFLLNFQVRVPFCKPLNPQGEKKEVGWEEKIIN